MGLLQKLSDTGLEPPVKEQPVLDKPVILKKSNSVGLLKKSLQASENRGLDFFEFTGNYNLEMCALLKNTNGEYRIKNCIGFDGESVCLSISTADFWDGTITQSNKSYSYNIDSSDALPFFQFFSNKLKERINTIQIIKTQNNSIFLICNNTLDVNSNLIADLEAVEKTETDFDSYSQNITGDFTGSFNLDFSEALESFVLSNSKNDIEFSKVIINEIYYELCRNFPEPEKIQYSSNGKFTLYVTESGIPVELLYNHIRVEFSFILANHSELLSVTENKSN